MHMTKPILDDYSNINMADSGKLCKEPQCITVLDDPSVCSFYNFLSLYQLFVDFII